MRALQCHFTWGLSSNHVTLLQLRDKLLDICPDESNPWRGHIYNLLGFLQTRLGHADEALIYFSSASEALRGPELLVNYSDLAWLHYERGEDNPTETERDRPSEEPLLPEVLAEKAWTLMKFGPQKLVAAEWFERALEEQPEHVEWRSSQAIALICAHRHHSTGVPLEALLKVQRAHEEDPENMYLRAEYLSQRVKRGEHVEEEEVAALMPRIIESAHSSYSGLKPALRYYRLTKALDVAIVWAEEALEKHPDSRYVMRCAALCYKWRGLFQKDRASKRHLLEKGVALLKEVIKMYPYTALVKEIDLADLYGKYDCAKAGEKYQALLQRPEIQQSRLSAHLEELQCHFTWELERDRELLFSFRDHLKDLVQDENNPWRGHIYNLLGFLQTRLGCLDEALSCFSSASEALRATSGKMALSLS
uniref:Interferon-induced protein with tetratricopeptide repeats 1-like n=1 Tax=Neogobius melanostomus TaxID=47308 RepID=A0A8C6TWJ3_9GOBI